MNNDDRGGKLKRTLGLPAAVLLVAGGIIGSGVFKKIIPMSQMLMSGPCIILTWVGAGVITLLGAFTYAGLAGATTKAGGTYEYLRLAHGNFIAYLFGWATFTIIGSGSIAGVAFVFAQSARALLPLSGYSINLLAISMIALLTWVNCRGVKKGSNLNTIVTCVKIGGILVLITCSFFFYKTHEMTALSPVINEAGKGTMTLSDFCGALLAALWAYDGWANITYVTGEIRNPARNIAYAIVAGVCIVIILYVSLNAAFLHVFSVSQFAAMDQSHVAAVDVAGRILGKTGLVVVGVLIMCATFGALNACILVYPRIYFRMAEENVFFSRTARINPVTGTPNMAIIYSSAWSAVLVMSSTFDQVSNLVIFCAYFFVGLAAWGLIKMKNRNLVTGRVIGYPVVPLLLLLFCVGFLTATALSRGMEAFYVFILVLSGVPFYFFFHRRAKRAASR